MLIGGGQPRHEPVPRGTVTLVCFSSGAVLWPAANRGMEPCWERAGSGLRPRHQSLAGLFLPADPKIRLQEQVDVGSRSPYKPVLFSKKRSTPL